MKTAKEDDCPMLYHNPILKGDYSDPDVIRVGEDFYMISSSFTYFPGIPVMHSRDLVNWELIGYAAKSLPLPRYANPAHKCGTWAPSIRYHKGTFYVYVGLPDEGIFAFTAKDPAGDWECHWVKDVSGWIDPCPLFDEDGQVYLVHGFAASRCGINNILYAHRMSTDGLKILDKGILVYSGADHGDVTVEGPKWYRRGNTYWILCPAGGVKPGYQLALRSDSVFGPYTKRIVLSQGSTDINGPHQGAWFDDGKGHDWFIHFQDIGAYGRVPHLQPVDWSDGWPVMGNAGEPVAEGDTFLPACPMSIPASDSFSECIGLQWQFQANPNPAWYSLRHPGLRLYAYPADTLFQAGQFLSQLMQAYTFDMDAVITFRPEDGDMAGVGMMAYPYHYLGWEKDRLVLRRGDITEFDRSIPERVEEVQLAEMPTKGHRLRLRLHVENGFMRFGAAPEGQEIQYIGETIPLSAGGWTGARPGIFCMNRNRRLGGYADVEAVTFTAFDGMEKGCMK